MKKIGIFGLLCAVLACSGCSSPSTPGNTNVNGPTVSIGAGSAYLYLVKSPAGTPVGVGAAITGSALASLSNNGVYLLPWKSGSGPIQVELDYRTSDAAPYDKPHLDLYFFVIGDSMLRPSILAGPDTFTVPSNYVPSGYEALSSISEAGKGIRYGDASAPELHGQPFQTAFYDGYHHGDMNYQEVSIDRAYLTSKWQGSVTVKQPANYSSGPIFAYAGSYSVRYDAPSDTYFVELDDLITAPAIVIN